MATGHLYVAAVHDGSGRFKVGQTRDLSSRSRSWAGSTDIRFELLHALPTPYPEAAEALAHAYLDARGGRPDGTRKELFVTTLEDAKDALAHAIRNVAPAAPRPARNPTSGASVLPLTSADPNVAALLRYALTFDKHQMELGHLMQLSLTNGRAQSRLRRMGIACSYNRPEAPEFLLMLEYGSALESWISSAHLPFSAEGTYVLLCEPIATA